MSKKILRLCHVGNTMKFMLSEFPRGHPKEDEEV